MGTHGGKRMGSGRKGYGKTKVYRLPVALEPKIMAMLAEYKASFDRDKKENVLEFENVTSSSQDFDLSGNVGGLKTVTTIKEGISSKVDGINKGSSSKSDGAPLENVTHSSQGLDENVTESNKGLVSEGLLTDDDNRSDSASKASSVVSVSISSDRKIFKEVFRDLTSQEVYQMNQILRRRGYSKSAAKKMSSSYAGRVKAFKKHPDLKKRFG